APPIGVEPHTVVHVLRYGDGGGQEWDGWFVHHKDWDKADPSVSDRIADPRYGKHLMEPRIFGSKDVRLAYAHINLLGFIIDKMPQTPAEVTALWTTLKVVAPPAADNADATVDNVNKFLSNESSGGLAVVSDSSQPYTCRQERREKGTTTSRIICLE